MSREPRTFFYGESGVVELTPRQWSPVPPIVAYHQLASDPSFLLDLGPRSLTDYSLRYHRRLNGAGSPIIKHLTYAGLIDCVTGYGSASERIVLELLKRPDLKLRLTPTGWWRDEEIDPRVVELMSDYRKRDARPPRSTSVEREGEGPPVWVRPPPSLADLELPTRWTLSLSIPPELKKLPSPRKLLYSMWESDTIPTRKSYELTGNPKMPEHWYEDPNAWPEWVDFYADMVAVPCPDQKRAWEAAGIQKPIHVVPLGVNDATYWYGPRLEHRPPLDDLTGKHTEPRDKFTLLLYGELSSNPRKPSLELIREVVYPVLHDKEDWQLIIKTRNNTVSNLANIHDDRIKTIHADYTPREMASLCHYADCGIVMSLYEGWGLPFREMMASGLPVIVSDNSGHSPDCDPDYNYPVPCPTKCEALTMVGNWMEPDWDAARHMLRREYEDWKARGRTQSAMGERAASWIRARRPYSKTVDALLGLIDDFEARG